MRSLSAFGAWVLKSPQPQLEFPKVAMGRRLFENSAMGRAVFLNSDIAGPGNTNSPKALALAGGRAPVGKNPISFVGALPKILPRSPSSVSNSGAQGP